MPEAAPDPAGVLRLAPPAGSRIVVVGACGGYGRPLTEALVAAGCAVTALDLPSSLDRFPPPAGVRHALPLDVRAPDAVAAAFARLATDVPTIDGLVYLVGYTLVPPSPLDTVAPADWDDVLDGNLKGAWLCLRAALPALRAAGSASVVTVSSALGYNLLPGFAPYGAAKAGLAALTKAVAAENAPAVRANAVAPSASRTAFLGGGMGRGGEDGNDEWFDAGSVPTPPLGRFCEPSDVVGPILFLLGPASRFMTGQVLHVNGGRFTP